MSSHDPIIEKFKNHFASKGLAVDSSSSDGEIVSLPPLRRLVQMFKAQEVRNLVESKYSNVDLLVGGTFSAMPVVGIFTMADDLSAQQLQDINRLDYLKTQELWSAIQDKNYFQSWKDWLLFYNNGVSALSGIFCLRYFVFKSSANYEKNKELIRTMKMRENLPIIGAYAFACDAEKGEVSAPKFTFWFGAGEFAPKKIAAFLSGGSD